MDTEGYLNELFHITQQQVNQQLSGLKSCWLGTIGQVFADGTVTVINPLAGPMPSAGEQINPGGVPVGTGQVYGPMPLATTFAGLSNGTNPINPGVISGIQLMPIGGSDIANNLEGELVLVLNLNNDIGYCTCALMLFSIGAIAPGLSVPITNVPLKPGEWLLVSPTGTNVLIDQKGDFRLYTVQPNSKVAGGNVNVFATGLGDGSNPGGSITLETGLINTVPTPAELPGDVWVRSIRNIEMRSLDFGLTTTFSITTFSGTNTNFGAAEAMNVQGNEVNILAADHLAMSGGTDVNIFSTSGMSFLFLNADATLTGQNNVAITANTQNIRMNATLGAISILAQTTLALGSVTGDSLLYAQGANVNIFAGVAGAVPGTQDINMEALNNINITADTGSINLLATLGSITASTGAGNPFTINSAQNTIINTTNIFNVNSGGGSGATPPGGNSVNLSSHDNIFLSSATYCEIDTGGYTAGVYPTTNDFVVHAYGGAVGIYAGVVPNFGKASENFDANITATGNINLHCAITAPSKTSAVGAFNVVCGTGTIDTPDANISMSCYGDGGITLNSLGLGNIEIETNATFNGNIIINAQSGQLELFSHQVGKLGGIITMAADENISVTAGTGMMIQLLATGGANIIVQDSSKNAVLALLTDAFRTAFNTHTHNAGAVGPPDTTIATGYPNTTNCLEAN